MMTRTLVFALIAVCVTFGSTGCATGPAPTPYSFAEDPRETATLTFEKSSKYKVNFLTFEGKKIPEPSPGAKWDPNLIIFPAGVPLITLVHVSYDGRDHFFWTGNMFDYGFVGDAHPGAIIGFLFVLGFTLSRDILWSPVVIGDIATAKSQATNRDVILECPALENGRDYKVRFNRRGKRYVLYITDKGSGRVIYEQEFERVEEKWDKGD